MESLLREATEVSVKRASSLSLDVLLPIVKALRWLSMIYASTVLCC